MYHMSQRVNFYFRYHVLNIQALYTSISNSVKRTYTYQELYLHVYTQQAKYSLIEPMESTYHIQCTSTSLVACDMHEVVAHEIEP